MAAGNTRPFNGNDFDNFLVQIRAGLTVTQAAKTVQFSPQTIWRHLRDDDEWRGRYQAARVDGRELKAVRAEELTWKIAEDGEHKNQWQAVDKLGNAYVPEFRQSQRLELTGDGGGAIQIESKEVSLTAIVAFAREHGILAELGLDRPGEALPATQALLPAPTE